jgi:citrate lyase subunit beta/citryl-CoA lyase
MLRRYRTVLFVPGHRPGWAEKALRVSPDAIVLDLEDAVPDEEKVSARIQVRESITQLRSSDSSVGILVRVNGLDTDLTAGDLDAVVSAELDGIFPPKIEGPEDVARFDALLDDVEARNHAKGLEYIVPIETVRGIQYARDIASASPRLKAMIGPTAEHADIAKEVGFEWTPEGLETLYLRSRVLLACREFGLHPLTGLWERIDDLEGLRIFAESGRRLGFRGMLAIHPSHVAVLRDVFSLSLDEVEFYQGMVFAYEGAIAEGSGALRYRGLHVDRAHYEKARERLAEAREQQSGEN